MTEEQKKRINQAEEGDSNFDGMACHPRVWNWLIKAGFETITDIEELSEKEFATRMHRSFEERYPNVNGHFDRTDKVIDILKSNGVKFKGAGDVVMAEAMYRTALQFASKDDYSRFAFMMEEAVNKGFDGDYSLLGSLYLLGRGEVEQDLEKAEKWYKRFVKDYENGKLNLDSKSGVLGVYYNLGLLCIIKATKAPIITI